MRKWLMGGSMIMVFLAGYIFMTGQDEITAADASETMIVHNVFFALKDNSVDNKTKLVAACKKYLSKHSGTEYFATGTQAEDFNRPVNDRDFDVALTIVFKNKAAHDKYQESPKHQQFIEENKENWKKVRVFDSTAERS